MQSFHPLFQAPSPIPPRKPFVVTWRQGKDGELQTTEVQAYSPQDALSIVSAPGVRLVDVKPAG